MRTCSEKNLDCISILQNLLKVEMIFCPYNIYNRQSRDDILSIQRLQSSNSFNIIKQLKIPKHIVLNVEKGTTIWRGGVDNKTETISGSRK